MPKVLKKMVPVDAKGKPFLFEERDLPVGSGGVTVFVDRQTGLDVDPHAISKEDRQAYSQSIAKRAPESAPYRAEIRPRMQLSRIPPAGVEWGGTWRELADVQKNHPSWTSCYEVYEVEDPS
jgi:hypothetical protein